MIKEIIKIAADYNIEIVPMINNYALNVKLDEYVNTGKEGLFIMLTESKEKRQRTYDQVSISMIELIASSQTSFSSNDVTDFYNVYEAEKSLEKKLDEVIGLLQDSGRFENVSRIRYTIYPYRYDSYQTVVKATFELAKSDVPC
ncbi:MAG: hypothetical protein II278_07460 [Bacteroidaceae bacterium]|nr:hypothetical protein [Bacteroidaceae bacterium]